MKTRFQLNKYTLTALLIVLLLLSVYVASITYQYEVVVRGILGLVVLYLLFFYIRFSKIDVSMEAILLDSKKSKYFIYVLIGPLIAYWATGQIFDTILFLFKR